MGTSRFIYPLITRWACEFSHCVATVNDVAVDLGHRVLCGCMFQFLLGATPRRRIALPHGGSTFNVLRNFPVTFPGGSTVLFSLILRLGPAFLLLSGEGLVNSRPWMDCEPHCSSILGVKLRERTTQVWQFTTHHSFSPFESRDFSGIKSLLPLSSLLHPLSSTCLPGAALTFWRAPTAQPMCVQIPGMMGSTSWF